MSAKKNNQIREIKRYGYVIFNFHFNSVILLHLFLQHGNRFRKGTTKERTRKARQDIKGDTE